METKVLAGLCRKGSHTTGMAVSCCWKAFAVPRRSAEDGQEQALRCHSGA